jgi:hypothetical protein
MSLEGGSRAGRVSLYCFTAAILQADDANGRSRLNL